MNHNSLNNKYYSFISIVFIIFSNPIHCFNFILPTNNTYIYSNKPNLFYMHTNRVFEGKRSKPWQGGKYGFSRNEKRTSYGIVLTRLHEGIDIKPLNRDNAGTPLDIVKSIAYGTVVYINNNPRNSSYGNYIVIHHDWGEGPFFSLYAHLGKIKCNLGQRVNIGSPIAILGYTGSGIDKDRAHLHLELNIILSDRFETWYAMHYKTPNHHNLYNGFNLSGIDIGRLYKEIKYNNLRSIQDFLKKEKTYYKVLIPGNRALGFINRYPILLKNSSETSNVKSWEFSFSNSGIPLSIKPSKESIIMPKITYVKKSKTNHIYHTVGRIKGTGKNAELTARGSRYIQLISNSF